MTERLSISLPDDMAAAIREQAEKAGWSVSAWIAHAANVQSERERRIAEGLRATQEFEQEYGPIPEDVRARARRELVEAGVIRPDEAERRAS